MNNQKKYLPLLLLPVLAVGIYFAVANVNQPEQEDVEILDNELTPEEVLESLSDDGLNEDEHDLKLSIISPEEETFSVGQARLYRGFLEGNGKYSGPIECLWQYYINENNEEYLLEEMEKTSVISEESTEVCGFTSTLVNKKGKLRVKLTVTVYEKSTDEILESITDERMYTVL